MLKTVKEVETKLRAAKPGRWAVGHGAYLSKRLLNDVIWIRRLLGAPIAECGSEAVRNIVMVRAHATHQFEKRHVAERLAPASAGKDVLVAHQSRHFAEQFDASIGERHSVL